MCVCPDLEAGKWQISSGQGNRPRWSTDGGTLFFFDSDNIMATKVEANQTFTRGTPKAFASRTNYNFRTGDNRYDVAADGRLLLRKHVAGSSDEAHIIVVQNWFSELQRLVVPE